LFQLVTPIVKTEDKKITNSKPIPHIPLPFKAVIADVLKAKPPDKELRAKPRKTRDFKRLLLPRDQ
jgi:hypothetical protein